MVTYADKPWLKFYDTGVPGDIDVPEIALPDFLRANAKAKPENIALVTSAKLPVLGRQVNTTSYGEVDELSDALAAGLVAMGLKKGDRIAVVMPNTVAFVVSFYAILKAGGVVAATNPTYPEDKMAYQLDDSDATFVLCLTLFYDMIKRIQPQTKVKTVIVANIKEYLPSTAKFLFTVARERKDGHRVAELKQGDHWFQDVLTQYAGQKPQVQVTPGDIAIFQYTGGTTGISKAAMSTHRALVANSLQQKAFLDVDNIPGDKQVMLGAIPLFHVFGMVAVLSVGIELGARIVLVPNARDIDDVVDVIHQLRPTLFHGVPALYNAINNHPDVQSGKAILTSVHLCVSGSAPLPPTVKREFERLSGASLREGFGMSECPTATHCNPVNREVRTGSIGVPLPSVEARIVSLDDEAKDVEFGEVGEMILSGPNLMVGYHNMDEETEHALREIDGKKWLYTGDIARMDEDGYFYIVDRKKDMALIGGFNVYPNNIEKVILEHPAVLEVGVASIPHPKHEGQEALKAWVVTKPDASVTQDELIAHCEQSLAGYEVPRRYGFIDELPKTAVGKTLRRELVHMEMHAREFEGA